MEPQAPARTKRPRAAAARHFLNRPVAPDSPGSASESEHEHERETKAPSMAESPSRSSKRRDRKSQDPNYEEAAPKASHKKGKQAKADKQAAVSATLPRMDPAKPLGQEIARVLGAPTTGPAASSSSSSSS